MCHGLLHWDTEMPDVLCHFICCLLVSYSLPPKAVMTCTGRIPLLPPKPTFGGAFPAGSNALSHSHVETLMMCRIDCAGTEELHSLGAKRRP
mmetsp:Transcript_4106/g.7346  ORF Transcript_4106/g.7346 Transcript_4106/m.7346 type:complete len:92 (-) Transcript_4106:270-545(-)